MLINQGFDCPRYFLNKALRGVDGITISAMENLESLVWKFRNMRSKAKNHVPFFQNQNKS